MYSDHVWSEFNHATNCTLIHCVEGVFYLCKKEGHTEKSLLGSTDLWEAWGRGVSKKKRGRTKHWLENWEKTNNIKSRSVAGAVGTNNAIYLINRVVCVLDLLIGVVFYVNNYCLHNIVTWCLLYVNIYHFIWSRSHISGLSG